MVTAALPAPGRLAARAGIRLRRAARRLRPAWPVLANLASTPLTAAGVGCIDAAVFMVSTVAGLAVIGVSLILIEYLIADEQ